MRPADHLGSEELHSTSNPDIEVGRAVGSEELHSSSHPDTEVGRMKIEDGTEEQPQMSVPVCVGLLVSITVVSWSVSAHVHGMTN